MIEAILAIMAVVAYFGGVATKDFIRPALPQRKQLAIIEPDPFATGIGWFNGNNDFRKQESEYYGSKNFNVSHAVDLMQAAQKWDDKRNNGNVRDIKLYRRMIKIHNNTSDLNARAAIVVMWKNHLLPAYLINEKADGNSAALNRYNETLDIISENLDVIEAGFQGAIELEQQQLISHLHEVRNALKPAPIDKNLDLSKPPTQAAIKAKRLPVTIHENSIIKVRKLAAENYPVYALAADYGVPKSVIIDILTNESVISYQLLDTEDDRV